MLYGSVKMYKQAQGWGFLRRDDHGDDVFVHIRELQRCGIRELRAGDAVTFDVVVDGKTGKPRAADVRVVHRSDETFSAGGWDPR